MYWFISDQQKIGQKRGRNYQFDTFMMIDEWGHTKSSENYWWAVQEKND